VFDEWENDVSCLYPDKNCWSLLIEWITTDDNCRKYQGNKSGESKMLFCKQISSYFVEMGCPEKQQDLVKSKLDKVFRVFISTNTWTKQTGAGVTEEEEFNAHVLSKCPYYFDLLPFMQDRAKCGPKFSSADRHHITKYVAKGSKGSTKSNNKPSKSSVVSGTMIGATIDILKDDEMNDDDDDEDDDDDDDDGNNNNNINSATINNNDETINAGMLTEPNVTSQMVATILSIATNRKQSNNQSQYNTPTFKHNRPSKKQRSNPDDDDFVEKLNKTNDAQYQLYLSQQENQRSATRLNNVSVVTKLKASGWSEEKIALIFPDLTYLLTDTTGYPVGSTSSQASSSQNSTLPSTPFNSSTTTNTTTQQNVSSPSNMNNKFGLPFDSPAARTRSKQPSVDV
jgi:hypothetical protein